MSEVKHHEPVDILVSIHQPEQVTLKGYVIGFGGSIVLTMTAYLFARYGLLNKPIMIALLSFLALAQFTLQMVYFLHLGREFSPRLKLLVTIFMMIIVFILVGGSIWIMNNLNGRVMSTKYMVKYMNSQNGL